MPPGREAQAYGTGGTNLLRCATTQMVPTKRPCRQATYTGRPRTPAMMAAHLSHRWEATNRTLGDSTTCLATSGSGPALPTASPMTAAKRNVQASIAPLDARPEAGLGTTPPHGCARLAATDARQRIDTRISASVSPNAETLDDRRTSRPRFPDDLLQASCKYRSGTGTVPTREVRTSISAPRQIPLFLRSSKALDATQPTASDS